MRDSGVDDQLREFEVRETRAERVCSELCIRFVDGDSNGQRNESAAVITHFGRSRFVKDGEGGHARRA